MIKVKRQKTRKVVPHKKTLKYQDYKNYLKVSQILNKVNYLEKKGINVDIPKEDKKEFMIKNRLILKTQQRLKSEKHNVFIEEINKIALSSNDDKIIQSIDSVETYAYRLSKDLIWKREKIKRINIIKQHKNV